MKRAALPVASLIGVVLLISACSQDPEPVALPAPVATTVAATTPAAGMSSYTMDQGQSGTVTLQVAQSATFGEYVVDGDGFTLYRFDPDSNNPSKATCNDDCAVTWPPTLASQTVRFAGLDRNALGGVQRQDGSVQMTVGGWPVYRFSKDTQPGQTNGEGVGGTWFVVAPDGSKASQN